MMPGGVLICKVCISVLQGEGEPCMVHGCIVRAWKHAIELAPDVCVLGVVLHTVDRWVIEECLGAIFWVSLIAVQGYKCSWP